MAKNDKAKAKASAPVVNERYKRMEALRKLFPGAVKDLAKTLGITEQEYYNLENTLPGAIKPAYIIDIAHYYGVSVAYMLGFTQNEGTFEGTPEKINEMRSCNLLDPWAPNVFAATKVFGSAVVEKSVKSVEKAGKETAKKVEKPVEKVEKLPAKTAEPAKVAPAKAAPAKAEPAKTAKPAETAKTAKTAEPTTEPPKRKYTRHQAWPTPAEAAALEKRKARMEEKKAAVADKTADAAITEAKQPEPIKAVVDVAAPVVKLTSPAPIIAEAKVDPNNIPLSSAEVVMKAMTDEEQGIAPTTEDNSIKDAVMSRMLENVAQAAPITAAPIVAAEPENKEIEVTLNLKVVAGTKMTINIDATSGVAVIK